MTSRMKFALLLVICLLGYTSLSFELIILRQLINFVGSNALITSIVMAFILLFLSCGYYIGSVISVAHRPIRRRVATLLYFLIFWYMLACSYTIIGGTVSVLYQLGTHSTLYIVLIFSALYLALPSAILGFATSVIGRVIHHSDSDYTGRFMAVDTIGSVLGSLVTTLVLMPLVGVSSTITVLAILTAIAAFILGNRQNPVLNTIKFAYALLFIAVLSWYTWHTTAKTLIKDDAISRMEIVAETKGDSIVKTMYVNGQAASIYSENDEYFAPYARFINENYLYTLPQDKIYNILILGAGGFTIGVKDTRNTYTYVDIEKNLEKVSEESFLEKPLTANKTFKFAEAYLFMLNSTEKYDIIVVDLFSALSSIPENFTTADFFELLQNHLTEDGLFIANIITSPSFNNSFSRRIDNTLRYVFKHNLNRQVIPPFNPYVNKLSNVIYTYFNRKTDTQIYTIDKNSALYGDMFNTNED